MTFCLQNTLNSSDPNNLPIKTILYGVGAKDEINSPPPTTPATAQVVKVVVSPAEFKIVCSPVVLRLKMLVIIKAFAFNKV